MEKQIRYGYEDTNITDGVYVQMPHDGISALEKRAGERK